MMRYSLFVLLGTLVVWACVTLLNADQSNYLINYPGLVIVLGGTLLTTILSQSFEKVHGLFRKLPGILRESRGDEWEDSETLLQLGNWYRRGNIRIADRMVDTLQEPVFRYGAELILDRNGRNDIVRLLRWKIGTLREMDIAEIQIVRTMAAFAPAFGMLGTLFGLVQMLYGLGDSGLAQIGNTMGFAMTTTVYGLIIANLIFKPLAIRMERKAKHRHAWMNVQFEAVLMVYEKRNPMMIQEYLEAFLGKPADGIVQAEASSHPA
ncbi:MAG: motility protein A [Gammaproteobacteria bacterium]